MKIAQSIVRSRPFIDSVEHLPGRGVGIQVPEEIPEGLFYSRVRMGLSPLCAQRSGLPYRKLEPYFPGILARTKLPPATVEEACHILIERGVAFEINVRLVLQLLELLD